MDTNPLSVETFTATKFVTANITEDEGYRQSSLSSVNLLNSNLQTR